MSIELYLLPFEGFKQKQFSHSILRLCGFNHYNGEFNAERDPELYDKLAILSLKAKGGKQFVPSGFASYLSYDEEHEEAHYGLTLKDSYENQLIYVFVKDLLELEKDHSDYYKDLENNVYKERALATMSYLKQLPKNRRIALYWT